MLFSILHAAVAAFAADHGPADEPAEPSVEEYVVEARRSELREGTASVTVVPIDESLPSSADLPSVISMAPGTQVRRLGGLGSYASVSIRGSSDRQVEVLLDGVPLNPDGASTMDLSELPLAALSSVEVYRGMAPFDLGAAPIGGVVHLRTREEPVAQGRLTLGSLRAARLAGLWRADPSEGPDLLVAGELTTAGNRYRFHDDAGTVYVPDDDTIRVRENADRHQGALHARWRLEGRHADLTLLQGWLVREEGVPGFAFSPTEEVRYETLSGLQAARVDAVVGATRLGVVAWARLRRERLRDALGEVGLGPRHNDERTFSPGLRATVGSALGPRLALHGLVDLHGDRFASRELLTGEEHEARHRLVGRAGAGARLVWGALELHPSVLLTSLHSGDVAVRSLDPRLGARLDLSRQLAITAQIARALRPPDVTELWGDRGAMRGNPALRPERATNTDLGLRWANDWVHAELVGFHGRARDRIVWVQNAQRIARPENLDQTRVLGLEAAATLTLGPLESWSSVTRTWSAQLSAQPAYDGKQLPRLPEWELHQRTALVFDRWRVGHTLVHASATWHDAVNWYRSAPRTLHGAFVRVGSERLQVEAEVSNLADRIVESVPSNPLEPHGPRSLQPVTDFAGMPLPGRTIQLSLRWTP